MKHFRGLTEQELNEFYNLMDVHFLSTTGEGFGIPTIESMACEVPQVQTDYTVANELVKQQNSGLVVPLCTEITGTYNVDRGMIDKEKAVEALSYLVENPDDARQFGVNGRRAVLREYDWKKVFPLWYNTVKRTIDG
ncbi:MAG TPA: glycosyltransferase [bacterium]|nr:glycosyltransferase [bacterium]